MAMAMVFGVSSMSSGPVKVSLNMLRVKSTYTSAAPSVSSLEFPMTIVLLPMTAAGAPNTQLVQSYGTVGANFWTNENLCGFAVHARIGVCVGVGVDDLE